MRRLSTSNSITQLGPATSVQLPRRRGWRISGSWTTIVVIVLTFGTAISPFILAGQKNGLVILACLLAGPLLVFARLPIGRDAFWAICAVLYFWTVEAVLGTRQDLITVGYTGLLALGYIAFCGALTTGLAQTFRFRHLLRRLVQAYAAVSILQMLTSLAGLPVPNLLLSKGLWSYNSLAVEPSHAARILAFAMLAYLLLSRRDGRPPSLRQLWRDEKWVLLAFVTSCILSGSSLAIGGLILTILLALRTHWMTIAACSLILAWPVLLAFQFESVERLTAFMEATTHMDLDMIVESDQSASVRIAPMLLFIDQMDIYSPSAWFGAGLGEIASYVRGRIPGVDPDVVMAGFFPGYIISVGFVGTALFLYAFVGRFFNRTTAPFVLLCFVMLSASAWNSQTFWFGLLMLRALHHFQKIQQRSVLGQ